MKRTDHLPLDHPLAACVEKLWRAHEHFELLKVEIKKVASGKVQPATFRTEFKPNSQQTIWTVVDTVNPPPLRLATIIGDMVHNLRSALDHLGFELSFLGTRGAIPSVKSQYPCAQARGGRRGWDSPRVQNEMLGGVLQKHRALIYQTQPCYRRKDTTLHKRRKRHPLTDLNNLWNEDKHRLLQVVVVAPIQIKPRIYGLRDLVRTGDPRLNRRFLGAPLKAGTEVLRVPVRVTGPDPHVNVDIEIGGAVRLRNGFPVVEALAQIATWTQQVVERFEPVFETPQARRLWGLPRGGWVEREQFSRPRTWESGWTFETITLPHDEPSVSTET